MVQGLDVSQWQKKLNWQKVATDYDFAIIKATGGRTSIDPAYQHNWAQARAYGLTLGPYHFYYTADGPAEQAKHFIKTALPNCKPHDLPPTLDLEQRSHNSNVTLASFTADIKSWLKRVEEAFEKRPIIYTDLSFANHWLTDISFAKYPLWIAYPGEQVRIPHTWLGEGYAFWQNGKRSINGIQFDYDTFNGNDLQLKNGEIINRPI